MTGIWWALQPVVFLGRPTDYVLKVELFSFLVESERTTKKAT